MRRWSSLQRELYKIVDDKIDFQIHVVVDRMDEYNALTRYWITVGFDYPKQFVLKTENGKKITNSAALKIIELRCKKAEQGAGYLKLFIRCGERICRARYSFVSAQATESSFCGSSHS